MTPVSLPPGRQSWATCARRSRPPRGGRGGRLLLAVLLTLVWAVGAHAQSATPEITSATTFAVEEGGTAVETLTATAADTDSLMWSIPTGGGDDAAHFTLSTAGDLTFTTAPDYENPADADGDNVYAVTVEVSDSTHTATADLEVTVVNVIELTTLAGPTAVEYAENEAVRVATYTASSEADRVGLEWELGGDDAEHFSIDTPGGVLRFDIDPSTPNLFPSPPDYENPADLDGDNVYEVTVQVSAGVDSASLDVDVTITDQAEPGALTLSTTRPQLGVVVTATLTDPDGVTGAVSYTWERSAGRNAWVAITGATEASYTPTAAEAGHFLRVRATYADGQGSGNTAGARSAEVVTAHHLHALAVTTTNATNGAAWRQLKPAFSPEILHYAVGCNTSDTMTLRLSAQDAATRVAVEGKQLSNPGARQETSVEQAVTGQSDVRIALSGADGATTTYVVHCLPPGLGVDVTTVKRAVSGVMEDLIMFVLRQSSLNHMMIIDPNAVPRFLRPHDGGGPYFRWHKAGEDGEWRYSSGTLSSILLLDQNLEEEARVRTVAPLTLTDNHDHRILDDGNYLLMSYQPARRDLSSLTFSKPNGQPFGTNERVEDSAIQIRTPEGEALFTWNSFDGMALEDCRMDQSDYAHLNAIEMLDNGDILASFRGCHRVLRIDPDHPDAHKVVWRVGPTNLTAEEWQAKNLGSAPLTFIGDPEGEIAGQHASTLLPNGNLLLYDNGVPTQRNPWTGEYSRPSGQFGRGVEYAVDTQNGEAIFLRDHTLHGGRDIPSGAAGHIDALANGDWLISWGYARDTRLDESVTQVDPHTGEEKFAIKVPTDNIGGREQGAQQGIRAVSLSPVALADEPTLLGAEIVATAGAPFHTGVTDRPTVVVAFSRPVVDFEKNTSSVHVTGATIEAVSPYLAAGAPAHAYRFTLIPDGDGAITFTLAATQPCTSGGICTADGTALTDIPAPHTIPGPITVSFTAASLSGTESASTTVTVQVSPAHGGSGPLEIPLVVQAESTATAGADYTVATSVVFAPTDTQQTFDIMVHPDDLVEGAETVVLGFGTLSAQVVAGSPATTTVRLIDTDETAVEFQFIAGNTQVAEGNAIDLTFRAVSDDDSTLATPVTFTTAQTITLTLNGSATAGTDYTLSAGGTTLAAPYTVALPAGAEAVTVTLTAVNDPDVEGAETVEVSAQHETTALGSRSVTIPPSDTVLPVVSITGPRSHLEEGNTLAFSLTRTGGTTAALPVTVAVTETASMLSGSPPTTITLPVGAASVPFNVSTGDDTVVEEASTVTVTVRATTNYEVGIPQAAFVPVADNDTAAFALTVTPNEIVEGAATEVRVAITNGVTFATDQTIHLTFAPGTATVYQESDYTVESETLILRAGDSAVTTSLTAVDDADEEAAERLMVAATHGTDAIGSAALTIAASDVPPTISITAGSDVSEGEDVVFTLTRAKVTEPTDLPALTVPVTVTDTDNRLRSQSVPLWPGSYGVGSTFAVAFVTGATTAELRLTTEDDAVIQVDPAASAVVATVEPADFTLTRAKGTEPTPTPPAYTVGEGRASVEVTENDVAQFALEIAPSTVTEGETARVTVSLTNGVTFDESQTITLFDQDPGTAVLGNGGRPDGDYTIHAQNGRERDHIRLRGGRESAYAEIRVRDDARSEGEETIRLAVRHPGTGTDIGNGMLTIMASDQVGRLQRATIAGARLTLTFAEILDTVQPPPATAFTVEAGAEERDLHDVAIETVTVSGRTVVLDLTEPVLTTDLVRVSYTDPTTEDDGAALQTTTGKDVESWRAEPVRPPHRVGGDGGGGGPDCAEDVHGNSAAQATALALDTATIGAICPAADVDYFTVTAPDRGLLFVDTTDGGNIQGTIWQNETVLASGPTGRRQADRLGARVQAGAVVVALQGQGGTTGNYDFAVTFVRGYLENPAAESFQSGVGVLSGWVCEAGMVELALNGMPQEAAYGTERLDTAGVCGDTDNGFGLLFNWNRLGEGEHEVVALVDGVELGKVTVTVTTLGKEFLRDMTGTCTVEDFPVVGETVGLQWQQNQQNFVLARGNPVTGVTPGRPSALMGLLENPGQNSFQSGLGVISGWVCEADAVELEIGHLGWQEAGYGTERLDTAEVCGDVDNGFGLLFNWNRLGEGAHEVVALVDGAILGRATVKVTMLGEEFLRDVEGECMVEDFPTDGEAVRLEWQQNSQNFVMTDVE